MGRHTRDAYYRHVHPVVRVIAGFFATLMTLGTGGAVLADKAPSSVSKNDPPPIEADDPRLPFPGEIAIVHWPAAPPHAAPGVNTAKPPAPKAKAHNPTVHHRPVKKVPSERRAPTPFRTTRVAVLLSFLAAQVGKSYVWGGNGPNGWDCSGLSQAAYKRVGVSLPRTSQEQSLRGVHVVLTSLRPGDLLFWGTPGHATHVAIYVGGGRYIAAQNHSVGVIRYPLSFFPPNFARRIL